MDTYQYAWFVIGNEGHTFDPGWRVVPGITVTTAVANGELVAVVLIERVVPTE